MATLPCVLYLLAFLGGAAASPQGGATSTKHGRALLQAQPCGAGNCGILLKDKCSFLTYPSGGPNEKSCNTGSAVTVALNDCFVNRAALSYVSVISPAPDGTCTRYGPTADAGQQAYKNGSTIAELQLKCSDSIIIFAKGTSVDGTQRNTPPTCRAGASPGCDTCRFPVRLQCPGSNVTGPDQVCRRATAACENNALCTSTSPYCPTNPVKNARFVCRPVASGSLCDVAETCDGDSRLCPADGFLKEGTVCRVNATACTLNATCSGTGAACPSTNPFALSSQVCRPATTICDVAEKCTGDSPDCPANTFQSNEKPCRAAPTNCTLPATCTGTNDQCGTNPNAPASQVCRPAVSICDEEESCTGSSRNCPPDGFKASDVQCRANSTACTLNATCTGTDSLCGDNPPAPADQVCRPAVDETCDKVETCTGSGPDCPADEFNDGEVCRESKGQCDAPETCLNGRCPTDLCVQTRTEIISEQPLCFPSAGTGQASTQAKTLMMG